jgi:proteasome lid subunit RPN8/RPN11
MPKKKKKTTGGDADAKPKGTGEAEAPKEEGPATDVGQIDLDEAKEAFFPESVAAEYRVVLSKKAFEAIQAHAKRDTSVEQCGVLAGKLCKDAAGPFLLAEEAIEGKGMRQSGARVTFTHETWDHVHEIMEKEHPDLRVVGWYHSHPGLGVFLSDMDQFIQDNFFNAPHNVAFVYDPIAKERGLFYWRKGRSERLRRYWIGDEVVYDLSDKDVAREAEDAKTRRKELEKKSGREEKGKEKRRLTGASEVIDEQRTTIFWAVLIFFALCGAALLGTQVAGCQAKKQVEALRVAAREHADALAGQLVQDKLDAHVRNYVRLGLFKEGLERELREADGKLIEVRERLAALGGTLPAAPGPDAAEAEKEQAAKRTKLLGELEQQVWDVQTAISRIQKNYTAADRTARQLKTLARLPQQVGMLAGAVQENRVTLARMHYREARRLLDHPGEDPHAARRQARRLRDKALRLAPQLRYEIDRNLPEFAPKRKPTTPPGGAESDDDS